MKTKKKEVLEFYYAAMKLLILALLVWMGMLCYVGIKRFHHNEDMQEGEGGIYKTIVAISVYIVLKIEFSLDALVTYCSQQMLLASSTSAQSKNDVQEQTQPLHHQTLEHPLGHGIIINSLLPLVLVNFISNKIFATMLLSVGASVACCGVLGKLQSFQSKKWTRSKALLILCLFLASETAFILSPVLRDQREAELLSIKLSLTCKIMALLTLLWQLRFTEAFSNSSSSSLSWFSCLSFSSIAELFTSCAFLCFLLSFGIILYLALQSFVLYYQNYVVVFNDTQIFTFRIASHILLVMMTAVLPGRIIRRNLHILQREMEYKRTFVRYISHEVRSPLSTITLGLECIQESLQASDEVTKQVPFLQSCTKDCLIACELATQTLNDLLLFDKIESNLMTLEKVEVNAQQYFENIFKPFPLLAKSANIDLIINPYADELDGISMSLDERKIEQVVRNFFTNALKFTNRSYTKEPQIQISVSRSPTSIQITTKDNGAGIAKVRS